MSDLITRVSESEAYFQVAAQATYYPSFVRIYMPHTPYKKLSPEFELADPYIPNGSTENPESDLDRSLRRTRKLIKDYALSNQFELFVTFTFKHDRQSITGSKTKMANWLKNNSKRKGKFEYLIVPEFHKDGQSLHFHALILGYKGEVRPSISPKTGRQLKQGKRLVYEIPSYTLGFTNVKKIDSGIDTLTKIAFYLHKYITKDMPLFAGKNRYWASRGLKKPVTEDNPEQWYLNAKPDRRYDTEYGTVLEFDRKNNVLADIFAESKLQ